MKTIATLSFILSLTIGILSPAQISHNEDFKKLIQETQATCPSLHCEHATIQARRLSVDEVSKLDESTLTALLHASGELAQDLWPDTILEGPYEAKFDVRIDTVEILYHGDQQIGYHITYSDRAWNTDTCLYDPTNPSSLTGCQEGRIMESGFVSNDFKTSFRDEAAYAHFIANSEGSPQP